MHLIIHGHFYQPPRQSPWLGVIEKQPDAAPFHDWNERIAAECYIPNTVSRILDDSFRIDAVVNNFDYLSFNVGPTLAAWLAAHEPATHDRILAADRRSVERLGGHGNAIAQVYNHAIIPLASPEDQRLQIARGVEDFTSRFARPPEGMWLSETAANDATLAQLIDHGIRFTILSPAQARSVRPIGAKRWKNVEDGRIDVSRPYRCFQRDSRGRADRDRWIDVLFFSRELTQAVSFGHLMRDAGGFADRIMSCRRQDDPAQMLLVATDGETFGHHEPFADMCLAYFFDRLAPALDVTMTNPGVYLSQFPPEMELRIKPGKDGLGTSWSCSHGVGRWMDDCGCGRAADGASNQKWRAPLRRGIDDMRATVADFVRRELDPVVKDVDRARIEYIHVAADHSPVACRDFVARHLKDPTCYDDLTTALTLLEADHVSMLSLSSCGWFFDELSGCEPVQNLRYVRRAAELVMQIKPGNILVPFLDTIEKALCNDTDMGNGRDVFMRRVEPTVFTATELVVSYAIAKLLTGDGACCSRYHYAVTEEAAKELGDGGKSIVGLLCVTDGITRERQRYAYFARQFSIQAIPVYVRRIDRTEDFHAMLAAIEKAGAEFGPGTMGGRTLGWSDLTEEVRERILSEVLADAREDLDRDLRVLYEAHRELMRTLVGAGLPIPKELLAVAKTALKGRLRKEVIAHRGDWRPRAFDRALATVEEAYVFGIDLQDDEVADFMTADLVATAQWIKTDPSAARFDEIASVLDITNLLGLKIKRFLAENIVIEVLEDKVMSWIRELADPGSDRQRYNEVRRILEVATRMNISPRRYREALAPFEEKL